MIGKIKKTAAALLAALTCVPLAACGTAATDDGAIENAAAATTAAVTVTQSEPSVTETVRDASEASEWTTSLADAGWATPDVAGDPNDYPDTYEVDADEKTVSIGSAEALAYFAHEVYASADGFAGYTVTLECDINLNNRLWIPIGFDVRANGTLPHGFKGTFNGNDKTIYNFSAAEFLDAISYTTKYIVSKDGVTVDLPLDGKEFHYGLFGTTGNAKIQNLTIDTFNFDFKAILDNSAKSTEIKSLIPDSVAGLIGFAGGSITVENCTVGNPETESKIICTDTTGGVVGRVYAGYNDANKTYGNVGVAGSIVVKKCKSYVDIGYNGETMGKGKKKAAGVVAYVLKVSELVFEDCENHGDIYGQHIGGILSYVQDAGMKTVGFKNCVNRGDIYQWGKYPGNNQVLHHTGGIAGRIGNSTTAEKLEITGCINYGNVMAEDCNSAGGVVGKFFMSSANGGQGELIKCFNYGSVSVDNANGYDVNGNEVLPSYCGGVIGELIASNITIGVGNIGKVAGGGTVNGCFGKASGTFKSLYEINGYEL